MGGETPNEAVLEEEGGFHSDEVDETGAADVAFGQLTAFMQRFSNQLLLKALYNTASRSPIHAHSHTETAVSATRGDSQLVGSGQGEAARSGTPRHSARRCRGSN